MTLIKCPQCGRKVLSVASTCPHCSFSLSEQRVKDAHRSSGTHCAECHRIIPAGAKQCPYCRAAAPARPRWLWGAAAAATAVAAAVIGLLLLGRLGHQPERAPPTPAAAPTQSRVDSVAAQPPPQAAPITARTEPPSPEQPVTVVRWTSTWVNVREDRSPDAPVIRILNPGERVDVADLQRGWWAVYRGGEMLGYVARSLIIEQPPDSG